MTEKRAKSSFHENRNSSDSPSAPVPILKTESELTGIGARIRGLFEGKESQRSFAKRAGVGETSLRDYINESSPPGSDALQRMADAGGVLVDYLITGKMPKTRAEFRAYQGQAQYMAGGEIASPAKIDHALLRQCLGACAIVHGEPFTAANCALQLEYAVDLYNALLPLVSPNLTLEDISRREARGLAAMLRGFLEIGAARAFK